MKTDLAKKKRNRRIAIAAGGVLTLTAILLTMGDAKAESKEPKEPEDPGTPGGGGSKVGGSGGIKGSGSTGGNTGPGGSLPDADDLPAPKDDPLGPSGGAKRTTPSDGGSGGAKRTSPDNSRTPRRTSPDTPDPVGPDPDIDELPDDFYNDEWPDPGKFYQVGSQDADGLYGIAWRWFYTCLFLAARNAGGLSEEAARKWANERIGSKGVAQAERADYLLCVAWNDIIYGSNTVAAKNRRGPHGRGIDLVPQHANNWRRILNRQRARRNVYLGDAGTVGTPSNAGKGDAKLPLLWLPRLDDKALWDSDGQLLQAAGTWADGSSFYHPPPSVMALGVDDATGSAGLGVWGCGGGQQYYGDN